MLKIRVPATSANLGPGFDCMGLALDIWNEVTFQTAEKTTYHVVGEGAEKLNRSPRNLLTRAFVRLHDLCGKKSPATAIELHNQILVSSGLGSSVAAIVAGLFGANELLGRPLDQAALLNLATEIEGHPDNVAAALLGGLVVSIVAHEELIARRFEIPELTVVIVKPGVDLPTRVARAVLPKSVSRTDAIFNIGRAALVVDALRTGDLDLLQKAMEDRIHQPYRLKHISGGLAAYKTAKRFGAAALSGAGPSIIAFVPPQNAERARASVAAVFEERGIQTRTIITKPSGTGARSA